MRRRRESLGLTVRDLAERAGLPTSSASYVSQMESGRKAPSLELARRLARALGDDERVYLAWAATARRSDPMETARAVLTLHELLRHPAYELGVRPGATHGGASGAGASTAEAKTWPGDEPRSSSLEALPALAPTGAQEVATVTPAALEDPTSLDAVAVPEIDEGADPGDETRPAPRTLIVHGIPGALPPGVEPLLRPFAYRLSESGVRRVRDALAPGDIAVLSRRTWPLVPSAPYAVRLSGHAMLARVVWNSRQLLVRAGPDDSDFLVLDAPGRTALERLLAGKVVARIRPGA